MRDGDVGSALLEVAHWISACPHDSVDQLVGLIDGTRWIVAEARLHGSPLGDVALALISRQHADVELLHSLLAFEQSDLGLARPALLHDAVVLGPESLLQICRSPLTHNSPNDQQDSDDGNNDQGHYFWIHGCG